MRTPEHSHCLDCGKVIRRGTWFCDACALRKGAS